MCGGEKVEILLSRLFDCSVRASRSDNEKNRP